MTRIVATRLAGLLTLLLISSSARADVSFNSIRLGTSDSEATATFYKEAFGMHEVNRIQTANGPEIFLNFGTTVDAARDNAGPPVVLMNRGPDDIVGDPMAHLILTVTDAAATAEAARAAGGTVPVEPRRYQDTPIVIGFVADPDGNQIELIQPGQ